jgi:8-oxo-dGTP pyrophosphatase MutT (NUDIX family)
MVYLERPRGFNHKFEIGSCFLERDGKFLLLLRQDHKPQGNTWGVPAGKIENGETSTEATLREIYEETGYSGKPEDLKFFKTVYVRFPEYDIVYHMFSLALSEDHIPVIDAKSHKDFSWVTPTESRTMPLIGGLEKCIDLFYSS